MVRPSVGPTMGPLVRPVARPPVGPVVRPPRGPVVRPPMGPGVRPVVWPVMRLTGRPPPTARTGELPRRSPISGGQAAESRRGARGGGHSSSLGSAKSRRGARGARDAPNNRVHGGDRRRPGGGRRPPPPRPPPAARPRRPSAARRRGGRRAPACRRRVARLLAAACPRRRGANAPVGAAWPPAARPLATRVSRSGAPPPAHHGRGATLRFATATWPGVTWTPRQRVARNLPWSRRVDRVLCTRRWLPRAPHSPTGAPGSAVTLGSALRRPPR